MGQWGGSCVAVGWITCGNSVAMGWVMGWVSGVGHMWQWDMAVGWWDRTCQLHLSDS